MTMTPITHLNKCQFKNSMTIIKIENAMRREHKNSFILPCLFKFLVFSRQSILFYVVGHEFSMEFESTIATIHFSIGFCMKEVGNRSIE